MCSFFRMLLIMFSPFSYSSFVALHYVFKRMYLAFFFAFMSSVIAGVFYLYSLSIGYYVLYLPKLYIAYHMLEYYYSSIRNRILYALVTIMAVLVFWYYGDVNYMTYSIKCLLTIEASVFLLYILSLFMQKNVEDSIKLAALFLVLYYATLMLRHFYSWDFTYLLMYVILTITLLSWSRHFQFELVEIRREYFMFGPIIAMLLYLFDYPIASLLILIWNFYAFFLCFAYFNQLNFPWIYVVNLFVFADLYFVVVGFACYPDFAGFLADYNSKFVEDFWPAFTAFNSLPYYVLMSMLFFANYIGTLHVFYRNQSYSFLGRDFVWVKCNYRSTSSGALMLLFIVFFGNIYHFVLAATVFTLIYMMMVYGLKKKDD